jgi:hypothetical protein
LDFEPDTKELEKFYNEENDDFFFFCVQSAQQTGRRSRNIIPTLTSLIAQAKAEKSDIATFQVIPNGIVVATVSKNQIFMFCSENLKINITLNSKTMTFNVTPTKKNSFGLFDIPLIFENTQLPTPLATSTPTPTSSTPHPTTPSATPPPPTTPPQNFKQPQHHHPQLQHHLQHHHQHHHHQHHLQNHHHHHHPQNINAQTN